MLHFTTLCIFFFIWTAVTLNIITVHRVKGQDGKLIINETVWTNGEKIEMICELKNTSLQTCSGALRETIFRKGIAPMCTVDLTWESKCLTSSLPYSDLSPAQCWCEKNSATGDVNYVYRFWADPQVHNGSWTCEKACKMSGILLPVAYNIDSSAGLNKVVEGKRPSTENLTSVCSLANTNYIEVTVEPDRDVFMYLSCNTTANATTTKTTDTTSPEDKTLPYKIGTGVGTGGGVIGGVCGCLIAIHLYRKYRKIALYTESHYEGVCISDAKHTEFVKELKKLADKYFMESKHVYFSVQSSHAQGSTGKIIKVLTACKESKDVPEAERKVEDLIKTYSDIPIDYPPSTTTPMAMHTTKDERKRKRTSKKKSTKVGEELTTINQKSPPESAAEDGNPTKSRDLPLPNPSSLPSIDSRMAPISHLTSVERNSYVDSPRTIRLPPIKSSEND